MIPQRMEPAVVPIIANNASSDAVEALMPYSCRIPGMTNPSVAGFITSTISATVRAETSPQCAKPNRALSKE